MPIRTRICSSNFFLSARLLFAFFLAQSLRNVLLYKSFSSIIGLLLKKRNSWKLICIKYSPLWNFKFARAVHKPWGNQHSINRSRAGNQVESFIENRGCSGRRCLQRERTQRDLRVVGAPRCIRFHDLLQLDLSRERAPRSYRGKRA